MTINSKQKNYDIKKPFIRKGFLSFCQLKSLFNYNIFYNRIVTCCNFNKVSSSV